MVTQSSMINSGRPPRTLGLSLAIIVSVLLFSVLPLLQTGAILLLDWRLRQAQLDIGGTDMIAGGGDFRGVDDVLLAFQAISGVIFLVLAVMAWRGRPRWSRGALIALVIILTVVSLLNAFAGLTAQPNASTGIDSGAEFARQLICGRLTLSILIPLYVIWYLNRAPARAFFRGYYLADPSERPSETQPNA